MALYHVLKRKREAQAKEAVLNPTNHFKRTLDKLIYFTGVATIIFAIPQATHIWINQNAGGVSLITWFAFFINAIVWSTYGVVHKEKPIIIMYFCYMLIDAFVVTGILIYT